jgi:hypothetical protein
MAATTAHLIYKEQCIKNQRKHCIICKEEKPFKEFAQLNSKDYSLWPSHGRCKKCYNAWRVEKRRTNPAYRESISLLNKKHYYKEDPIKKKREAKIYRDKISHELTDLYIRNVIVCGLKRQTNNNINNYEPSSEIINMHRQYIRIQRLLNVKE